MINDGMGHPPYCRVRVPTALQKRFVRAYFILGYNPRVLRILWAGMPVMT